MPRGTTGVFTTPPSDITCGQVTLSATAMPLLSDSSYSDYIFLMAPLSGQVASNTEYAFAGDATTQNIPIATNDVEGFRLDIDDPSKVYVKGKTGEKLNYAIFGNE